MNTLSLLETLCAESILPIINSVPEPSDPTADTLTSDPMGDS